MCGWHMIQPVASMEQSIFRQEVRCEMELAVRRRFDTRGIPSGGTALQR